MVFETKDADKKSSNKRLSRRSRCNKDRQLNQSPKVSRNTGSVEMRVTIQAGHVFLRKNIKSSALEKMEPLIDKQGSDEGKANEGGNEEEIIPAKEEQHLVGGKLASGSLRRRHQVEETQTSNGRPTVSVESSDSNQSDGSTGSFAFPVLGWERMGSPVQMPKSEDIIINPRKNKPLCALSMF
ncbi:hypothetical protein REPUB_Repub08aG0053300 [Reevesia pubescens]